MVNIESIQIGTRVLSMMAEIDEFKGVWRALGQLAPEQLSSLKKVATVESIGSSTRIEKSRNRTVISDIVLLTGANRNTIKKHLETLVRNNQLVKHGAGKATWYAVNRGMVSGSR